MINRNTSALRGNRRMDTRGARRSTKWGTGVSYCSGLFSDVFLPVMDGVTVTVYNYALWLNRTLGPAAVVTPGFPGYVDEEEFAVFRCRSIPIPQRPPYRFAVPRLDGSARRGLRDTKFDLVHAHSPFSAGRTALRLARRRRIPLVATFHTKYRDDFQTNVPFEPVVDWIVRRIVEFYSAADEVWVPNARTGETLESYGYRGDYQVVANGVDLDGQGRKSGLREEGQRLLGLQDDDFLLMFVGQHVWEKNLAFLIQALARLKALGRSFRMAFVGEGYARKQMEEMVRRLDIGEVTRFVGVIRDRRLLSAYYARADLLLFPSLYDNAPLAVREAASFHVPAVVLQESNTAENVVDGVNGFLAAGSVDAYAERLAALMDDSRLVKKVGRKAQKTLCRSWEDVAEEVADRYVHLITGNRR